MKKLHSIRLAKVGDITSPKQFSQKNWFNFLKTQLARKVKFLVKSGKITGKEARQFIDCWTSQRGKLPKRSFQPTLVHNDVHLDNVLITKSKQLYLIDFEDSFYGDPLYDLIPFSDFHPRLFPKLKKFYNNKTVFNSGWQEWFKVYEFIHWVSLGAFYIDIGKQRIFQRYLSKILNFCQQRKTYPPKF